MGHVTKCFFLDRIQIILRNHTVTLSSPISSSSLHLYMYILYISLIQSAYKEWRMGRLIWATMSTYAGRHCFLLDTAKSARFCYSIYRRTKIAAHITKTCLYNFDPLKPHFYIVKLGFTGVYIIFFLFLLKNIDCGYSLEPPRRGGSNEYPESMFWAELWKISVFYLKIFSFLELKFSIYLNRRVFVMNLRVISRWTCIANDKTFYLMGTSMFLHAIEWNKFM